MTTPKRGDGSNPRSTLAVMAWALDQVPRGGGPAAKLVLVMLASRVDQDGRAVIDHAPGFAARCCITVEHLTGSLSFLAEQRIITIEAPGVFLFP